MICTMNFKELRYGFGMGKRKVMWGSQLQGLAGGEAEIIKMESWVGEKYDAVTNLMQCWF